MNIKKIVIACSLAAIACAAQAFQIISLSPQGEVARVRQVVAKFDESAVNFGDPKAPAPLSLSCSDAQATKGSARWIRTGRAQRERPVRALPPSPPFAPACVHRCNAFPCKPCSNTCASCRPAM